jgi:Protein of unknown function (DUF2752)
VFTRATYLLFALAACAVLAVASGLTPEAAGLGTHRQFGLPACGILGRTGWPCPSCGLTTSFALAARGRLADAALVQPFGLLLFTLTALAIPALFYWTARPLPLGRVFDPDRAVRALQIGGCLYVAAWAYRSYVHYLQFAE